MNSVAAITYIGFMIKLKMVIVESFEFQSVLIKS